MGPEPRSTTRRDASGQAVGVIGVGQDVTEQKKAIPQLRQNPKFFMSYDAEIV
jgi:signal transduction histidine kinase